MAGGTGAVVTPVPNFSKEAIVCVMPHCLPRPLRAEGRSIWISPYDGSKFSISVVRLDAGRRRGERRVSIGAIPPRAAAVGNRASARNSAEPRASRTLQSGLADLCHRAARRAHDRCGSRGAAASLSPSHAGRDLDPSANGIRRCPDRRPLYGRFGRPREAGAAVWIGESRRADRGASRGEHHQLPPHDYCASRWSRSRWPIRPPSSKSPASISSDRTEPSRWAAMAA